MALWYYPFREVNKRANTDIFLVYDQFGILKGYEHEISIFIYFLTIVNGYDTWQTHESMDSILKIYYSRRQRRLQWRSSSRWPATRSGRSWSRWKCFHSPHCNAVHKARQQVQCLCIAKHTEWVSEKFRLRFVWKAIYCALNLKVQILNHIHNIILSYQKNNYISC